MIPRPARAVLGTGLLIVALVFPTLVHAKLARITGKLSKPGYSVLAVAANGETKTGRAPKGRFELRPPARKVTLQLRAPGATYAGPVVIAKANRGTQAILGVRAGARLGRIKLDPVAGYARVAKRLPDRYIVDHRTAEAERGIPVGAGNLGRVESTAPADAPADEDGDGIPDPFDVDDDGDLVDDRFDRDAAAARAEAASADVVVAGRSLLDLDLPEVVNANISGLSDAQIEAALPRFGGLILGALGIEASGPDSPPVELDCGDPDTGLIYCRKNGSTGKVIRIQDVPMPSVDGSTPYPDPASPGDPYPGCCDPDGDGFGSLGWTVIPGVAIDVHAVALQHGATSDQIDAGDLLIARAANEAFAGTLSYVFETVPALVSITDEAGNTTAMSYPVTPRAPGTRENPFIASDGPDPDTDLEVTMTFWRPQREALPNEPGRWIDVGHTAYIATRRTPSERPGAFFGGSCPASAYSETDPNLAPVQAPDFPRFFEPVSGLEDSSDDQPANPANTFTFTLDLNRCFGPSSVWPLMGLYLRAQPANPLLGPPDNSRATVAWFAPGSR